MIDRRSLLSVVGASVTGALSMKGAPRPTTGGIVSLESFHVADSEQLPRLHAYLDGALLPLLNENSTSPVICLEALVAPKTPQVLLLSVHSSFDQMLASRNRIAANSSLQNKRAELESGGVVTGVDSQILIAQPGLRLPAKAEHLRADIFELRSYHCPAWQTAPRAALTAALNRAGIHPIVDAAFAAGEHIPQFTYLIPFQSLAARQEAWSQLAADPEWIGIERQAAKDGSCLRVTAKSIYKLAPYSRLA
jgi:hypothetical protein